MTIHHLPARCRAEPGAPFEPGDDDLEWCLVDPALPPGAILGPYRAIPLHEGGRRRLRRRRRLDVALALAAGLLVLAVAWWWQLLAPAVLELLS